MEILAYFLIIFASAYIGVIVTFILSIIIHESGHLIFGLTSKYKFVSFRILNIMIIKRNEKFSIKRYNIAGTGGQCIMEPMDIIDGKFPVILYNIGGSLLNFIFAIIFLILYFIFKDTSILKYFLSAFVFWNFFSGLLNIIPFKTKLISNDGKNLVEILKNREAFISFWRALKIISLQSKGINMIDMPKELFEKPKAEGLQNCIIASDSYFYALRLQSEGKFLEMKEYIEEVLSIDSKLNGIYISLLKSELIYCKLLLNDVEDIENIIDNKQKAFFKQMKSELAIIRTQYLLALYYYKDKIDAEKFLNSFNKYSKNYPFENLIEEEKELINKVENFYENTYLEKNM
ncbi:MAG: site-2 protease family protein [Lachnospirales bacterium]